MTRRDNGLPGDEWQLLTDLAPPLADHVLELLRDEGIAAYAEPSTGRTGPYLETHAQERPVDEVFVGRTEFDRARTLLDGVLPRLRAELDEEEKTPRGAGSDLSSRISTDDDVWAGIVAAYSAPAADPVGRWSVTEDAPAETAADDAAQATEAGAPADDTAPTTPRREATGFEDIRAELDADRAEREASAPAPADDPHDHYVPPPPPPIPEGDTVTRLAWAGILGGPLWLILATLLGWGPGGLSGLLAVLAFVGGFVTLVARMGDDREDDGDDGAVV